MNKLIENGKKYLLTSGANDTFEKVLLIAFTAPIVMYLIDKLTDLANNALENGYDFSCNAKELSVDLTKSS